MNMTELTYTVRIHQESDEGFWAEVEELPGCFATGETLEELWESVSESIGLYLSTPDSRVEVQMQHSDPTPTRREVIETHRVAVCT